MKCQSINFALIGCMILAVNTITADESYSDGGEGELSVETSQPTDVLEEAKLSEMNLIEGIMPDLHRQMTEDVWESKDSLSKLKTVVVSTSTAWGGSERDQQAIGTALDRTQKMVSDLDQSASWELDFAASRIISQAADLEDLKDLVGRAEGLLVSALREERPEHIQEFQQCVSEAHDRAGRKSVKSQVRFLRDVAKWDDTDESRESLSDHTWDRTLVLMSRFFAHSLSVFDDFVLCMDDI